MQLVRLGSVVVVALASTVLLSVLRTCRRSGVFDVTVMVILQSCPLLGFALGSKYQREQNTPCNMCARFVLFKFCAGNSFFLLSPHVRVQM